MTTTISAQWQARIDAEQELTHETIAGKQYPRVRYGDAPDEKGTNLKPQCNWCGVELGQFHVSPCDGEVCAACGELCSCCDCALVEGPTQ